MLIRVRSKGTTRRDVRSFHILGRSAHQGRPTTNFLLLAQSVTRQAICWQCLRVWSLFGENGFFLPSRVWGVRFGSAPELLFQKRITRSEWELWGREGGQRRVDAGPPQSISAARLLAAPPRGEQDHGFSLEPVGHARALAPTSIELLGRPRIREVNCQAAFTKGVGQGWLTPNRTFRV